MRGKSAVFSFRVLGTILCCLSACGGEPGGGGGNGSGGGGNGGGSSRSCTITLSGAVNQTMACTTHAAWSPALGQTVVQLNPTNAGQTVVVLLVQYPGNGGTGTFRETDPGAAASLSVAIGASELFFAGSQSPNNSGAGSYTLVLSKVTRTADSSQESYDIQGSLDASLMAVVGSGAVTLHAEF